MPSRIPLPPAIVQSKIVAVLRAPTAEFIVPVALELFDLGVTCLEVALSSPGALDALEDLSGRLSADAALGAGTVLSVEDVRRATEVGATYLLSPVTDPTVLVEAQNRGVAFVPGAGTASEIFQGWQLGASAVKVFPAHSLGGPSFIKSILDPLPFVELMSTGGIAAGDVAGYLDAGAIAVGIGSPLTGDALRGGSLTELRIRVRAFLAAVVPQDGSVQ